MQTKLHIELTTADYVPEDVIPTAKLIMNSPDATLVEKLLARLLIVVAMSHNKLVDQLDYGTARIVVEEQDSSHPV